MDKTVERLVKGDNEYSEIVNDLNSRISTNRIDAHAIQTIFRNLAKYSANQFNLENDLMKNKKIDERFSKSVKKSQDEFIGEMVKLCEEITTDKRKINLLLYYLISWLDKHVVYDNNLLLKQVELIEKGKKPAEAFELTHFKNRSTVSLVNLVNSSMNRLFEENRELHAAKTALENNLSKRNKELQSMSNKINSIAISDAVTGLPNRRFVIRTLSQLLKESKTAKTRFATMLVKFNEFKDISDVRGVDKAREVMSVIANIAKSAVRSDDVICSLNNDEIAIVCPHCTETSAINIATTIKNNLKLQPIVDEVKEGDDNLDVSLSFGITICDGSNAIELKDILQRTDACLKKAKINGKLQVETLS